MTPKQIKKTMHPKIYKEWLQSEAAKTKKRLDPDIKPIREDSIKYNESEPLNSTYREFKKLYEPFKIDSDRDNVTCEGRFRIPVLNSTYRYIIVNRPLSRDLLSWCRKRGLKPFTVNPKDKSNIDQFLKEFLDYRDLVNS